MFWLAPVIGAAIAGFVYKASMENPAVERAGDRVLPRKPQASADTAVVLNTGCRISMSGERNRLAGPK